MIVYVLKTKSGYIGLKDDIVCFDYKIDFGHNQAHYGTYIKSFSDKEVLAFPNKEQAIKFVKGLANQDVEIEKYFVPNYAENLDKVIAHTCKMLYDETW